MGVRGAVATLAAVVGLAGCSKINQVFKDTKDMKETLGDVSRKGDHIAKRTDDLERELKLKESTGEFTRYMDRVFGENGMGVDSPDARNSNPETEMIADSQKAVHALLFQFWKGDFNEGSIESLDLDMEKSALLFFTRVKKYVDRTNDIESMNPDRAYKGLASLGARLDSVEPSFQKALALKGLPGNTSFYEIVMQALRDRDHVVQAGFLPKAKTSILQWKREAIFTVQLRHNYLPMMVLSRMSDFADRGLIGRGLMALLGARINLNSRDPELSISNALLVEMTKWLNQASETRERLREIGIRPKYNSMFARILNGIDFGQADIISRRASTGDEGRDRLLYDFALAYQRVGREMAALTFGSEAPVAPLPPSP
jgi:hypothetical protein